MEQIETTSTSARSAECTPIVLRETDTRRLTFQPEIVDNPDNPRACIRGDFIYERKGARDTWERVETVSLNSIKTGEQYKLELKSAELLELATTLWPLYRAQWLQRRVAPGKQVYVKADAEVTKLVATSQTDIEKLLKANPDRAIAILGTLIRWLSSGEVSQDVAKTLSEIDPSQLPAVSSLLGLSALRAALAEWEGNRGNASEDFWQAALGKHSFVLSQLFAHPIVVIQEKAYLGGKAIDNKGGSYLDFLAASSATEAAALIEIKTPTTPLLGSQYRGGAYGISSDLTGAIAQVLKYRHTFSTDFDRLCRESGRELVLGSTPCIVISGDCQQLDTPDKRESFESFRSQLGDVDIVTFDELFLKLKVSADLLEGITVSTQ